MSQTRGMASSLGYGTMRATLGMLRLGFLISPAARAIRSGPDTENAAYTMTDQKPRNLPVTPVV